MKRIDLEGDDGIVSVEIDGLPVVVITNRLDEGFIEIEVFDMDENQIICQSVRSDALKF